MFVEYVLFEVKGFVVYFVMIECFEERFLLGGVFVDDEEVCEVVGYWFCFFLREGEVLCGIICVVMFC